MLSRWRPQREDGSGLSRCHLSLADRLHCEIRRAGPAHEAEESAGAARSSVVRHASEQRASTVGPRFAIVKDASDRARCYDERMGAPTIRKADVELPIDDDCDPVDDAFRDAPLDEMPETDAERAMMAAARAEPQAWVSNEDHLNALAERIRRER